MRTEVNIFFAVLFVCSFIVSIAFTNEENERGHKVNGEFDEYTNSGVSNNKKSIETVAPSSSDTSMKHRKNG